LKTVLNELNNKYFEDKNAPQDLAPLGTPLNPGLATRRRV